MSYLRHSAFLCAMGIALLGCVGYAQLPSQGYALSPIKTSTGLAKTGVQTGAFNKDVSLRDVLKPDEVRNIAHIYPEDESLSWSLFVPLHYSPRNPPGVLVYISPSTTGKLPRQWRDILSDENYIYISANGAGNKVPANRRILNASLAVQYVNSKYHIDPNRVVVSGFSGGARISTLVIETLPKVFKGALLMGGALKWRGDTTHIKPVLQSGTYVFVTGRRDQARKEMRSVYKQYKAAGVKGLKFIDVPNLGHSLPKTKTFREALSFFPSARAD